MILNLTELMRAGEPIRLTWGDKTFDCFLVAIRQDHDSVVEDSLGRKLTTPGELRVTFQPTGPPRG